MKIQKMRTINLKKRRGTIKRKIKIKIKIQIKKKNKKKMKMYLNRAKKYQRKKVINLK